MEWYCSIKLSAKASFFDRIKYPVHSGKPCNTFLHIYYGFEITQFLQYNKICKITVALQSKRFMKQTLSHQGTISKAF
jgi:hypothetical protein